MPLIMSSDAKAVCKYFTKHNANACVISHIGSKSWKLVRAPHVSTRGGLLLNTTSTRSAPGMKSKLPQVKLSQNNARGCCWAYTHAVSVRWVYFARCIASDCWKPPLSVIPSAHCTPDLNDMSRGKGSGFVQLARLASISLWVRPRISLKFEFPLLRAGLLFKRGVNGLPTKSPLHWNIMLPLVWLFAALNLCSSGKWSFQTTALRVERGHVIVRGGLTLLKRIDN